MNLSLKSGFGVDVWISVLITDARESAITFVSQPCDITHSHHVYLDGERSSENHTEVKNTGPILILWWCCDICCAK